LELIVITNHASLLCWGQVAEPFAGMCSHVWSFVGDVFC